MITYTVGQCLCQPSFNTWQQLPAHRCTSDAGAYHVKEIEPCCSCVASLSATAVWFKCIQHITNIASSLISKPATLSYETDQSVFAPAVVIACCCSCMLTVLHKAGSVLPCICLLVQPQSSSTAHASVRVSASRSCAACRCAGPSACHCQSP